jgi:hypothetical protein
LKAEKDAEAKEEQAQKTDAEKKQVKDHLKICISSCPCRPEKEDAASPEPKPEVVEELKENEVVVVGGEKFLRLQQGRGQKT